MWKEPDRYLRNDSTSDNEDHSIPATSDARNMLDGPFNPETMSRGMIYINDLMVDLGVRDEISNQILSAVIQLFTKLSVY